MFAEVYPVEACYAVRRCTLITKGAVTETLTVSASVSSFPGHSIPTPQQWCQVHV